MSSPAMAGPSPAQGVSPAASSATNFDAASFAGIHLPSAFGGRQHPGTAKKLGLAAALKGLAAALLFGFSPGASLLLAGAVSMTAGKQSAPLAQSAPAAPLVSSASPGQLACVGCVSHHATGSHGASGMT